MSAFVPIRAGKQLGEQLQAQQRLHRTWPAGFAETVFANSMDSTTMNSKLHAVTAQTILLPPLRSLLLEPKSFPSKPQTLHPKLDFINHLSHAKEDKSFSRGQSFQLVTSAKRARTATNQGTGNGKLSAVNCEYQAGILWRQAREGTSSIQGVARHYGQRPMQFGQIFEIMQGHFIPQRTRRNRLTNVDLPLGVKLSTLPKAAYSGLEATRYNAGQGCEPYLRLLNVLALCLSSFVGDGIIEGRECLSPMWDWFMFDFSPADQNVQDFASAKNESVPSTTRTRCSFPAMSFIPESEELEPIWSASMFYRAKNIEAD
ncbi:hypothetical protein EDD85DRAFT_995346 [Armillaria nabsnona]|nr:hypothetical protein EDD85DRAFT_995346 [Armillaria nabsnona]